MNTFKQLLTQEFLCKSRDVIIDEKTSAKILSLIQKEEKDLYTYYRWIKELLKGIHRRDRIVNSSRDKVILGPAKHQPLKDTIIQLTLGIRNPDFLFHIVDNYANPMPSFYDTYKQAKSTLFLFLT